MISWARPSSIRRRSFWVSVGDSRPASISPTRLCLRLTLLRIASVGWAVRTNPTFMPSSTRCRSPAPIPSSLRRESALATEARCGGLSGETP
ncbi:MAG: hypothetical protein M3N33_09470 [Actinomycetota bacterium]|nr:hypothetical protein [Actinomycetota bacterium]